MAGVRIRHLTAKGPAIIVIRDLSHRGDADPDGNYPGCSACSLPSPGHEGYKTKHLRIDADGYAIVSPEYWLDLQRFIDHGQFEYANEVPDPPRQQLLVVANRDGSVRDSKLVVHHKMARPITTKG